MSTDTHTIHLYAPVDQILEGREGDRISYVTFGSNDMSDDYWGYICSREISIDRPSRETFLPKQVAILRAAMTQVDLKAAQAKADLAEKIENLLALSYEASDDPKNYATSVEIEGVDAMTPEVQARVNMWRQRAAEGSLTPDEMKGAIAILREGRANAAKSSAAAVRTKAKAAIPSADDLLRELGIE